ncbi:MAG: peptidoglycan DD-metalloendopeptidase family protein [Gammaproteobacteria bacterium]|nr:peptidoglycan DD-metalloendopeptidase family protein [Gammaproteobacteria bacterium]
MALTAVGILGIPAIVGLLCYQYWPGGVGLDNQMIDQWRDVLKAQQSDVDEARRISSESLDAYTLQLARLQARVMRLDALGERLITYTDIKEGEFDFSQSPGLGGPLMEDDSGNQPISNYFQMLDRLEEDIENRDQQLSILETLLIDQKIRDDIFISGRPVQSGWISSYFGMRNDPINGKRAWHSGVDFAGKANTEIRAVAAGAVKFAGYKNGYGQLIEINHGNGYKTLYGHHKEIHVSVGDIVKKGQVIGIMGNSGRSTGNHVHYEVHKNGRVVDPSSYIHRASR